MAYDNYPVPDPLPENVTAPPAPGHIGFNYRPVQDIGSRTVYYHGQTVSPTTESTTAGAIATGQHFHVFFYIILLCVICMTQAR